MNKKDLIGEVAKLVGTKKEAQAAVASGALSAVSFGRYFIGNPDLVARWRKGLALADFDLDSLYTPGEQGFTTYPAATQG